MRAFAIRIPRRATGRFGRTPGWPGLSHGGPPCRLGDPHFCALYDISSTVSKQFANEKIYEAASRDDLALARSSLGDDFTVPRPLYCAFGCVLGGAVLDGAALGFALAFAFFFFFGAVSAPAVAGGAPVSCWALASDAVSSAAAGTASLVASPASKSTFRQACRSMLKFPN